MQTKTDTQQEIHERIVKALGTTTSQNVVANMEALLGYVADLGAVWPSKCKEVPSEAWINATIYGNHVSASWLESDLAKRLHSLRIHPDWEYRAVEHSRKGGYSNPPEGHGWVDNEFHDNGVTRYECTEHHHFRRLKIDALKDDIDLYNLPAPVPQKVTVEMYLYKLRNVFCKAYMPSSTTDRESNHSPKNVLRIADITSMINGIDVYVIENGPDFIDHSTSEALTGELQEKFFFNPEGKPNLIFAMEIDGLRILTCLQTDETFVTTKRKDDTWQGWISWSAWLNLPIDRYTLDEFLKHF